MCDYPGKRARFHARYCDLKEDVDYKYLSVPIKACGGAAMVRGGVEGDEAESGTSLRGTGGVDGGQEDPADFQAIVKFSAAGFAIEAL